MIKGFIFDLDGTLFDTERMLVRFWNLAGRAYGYDIRPEHVTAIRSTAPDKAEKILQSFHGPDFNYRKIRNLRRDLMNKEINEKGLPEKPGMREILSFAREKGIRCAVATATDKVRTSWYLEKAGVRGFFDAIVTTEDVRSPKPAPDIYVFAAGMIGCQPKEACAFEDSPNGVISANTARCKVFFIPDMTEADKKTSDYAHYVCKDLNEAREIIEKEGLLK